MPIFSLNPNNITPLSRTPWAGTLLAEMKKASFPEVMWPEKVGEAWEVSPGPEFPSQVVPELRKHRVISQVVKKTGCQQSSSQGLQTEVTSATASLKSSTTGSPMTDSQLKLLERSWEGSPFPSYLMLKTINASMPLSLQVHPAPNDVGLAEDECAKPEAWYVLKANPGAYVYLGIHSGVTREGFTKALHVGQLQDVLYRVEVKEGDYLSVPPGLVHAIGEGCVLVEPQYVVPGKKGKTFRLYDWKRRYLASGELSEHGSERELHLHQGLACIDWSLPAGEEISKQLVHRVEVGEPFIANSYNPFSLEKRCFHSAQELQKYLLKKGAGIGYVLQGSFHSQFSQVSPLQAFLFCGKVEELCFAPGSTPVTILFF